MAQQEGESPLVARVQPAGWLAWLVALVRTGQARLAALGLTVVLGFGLGLASLWLFGWLADEVFERDTLLVDTAVLAWLRAARSPTLDGLAWLFSFLGAGGLAVILIVVVVWLGLRGRWGAAGGVLLVTGGAQALNNVLKELFQRTRPAPVDAWVPAQAFSFPSGHAMVAAAFYLFLAYLAWRVLHGWPRVAVACGLVLLILLIGLSRLYLGVHYLSDVAAGYLAGFLWTDAVILGGALLERRRAPRGPPPRPVSLT